MYKKQEILFERGYMINDNGNIGLDIEIKYTKYKMCLSMMMAICIKKHLSNIWSSIYEKVKHNWDWVKKSVGYKKAFICQNWFMWK